LDDEHLAEFAKTCAMGENGVMADLERILTLWRELESAGRDYVLATVIAVEGPSYRKPGAFMLLSADGRRAGTVSGGCLEAQVAQRAWWLTENGPTIQRYSTVEDDGDRPFGSGCGGVVSLLLARRATTGRLLEALAEAFEQRVPMAIATVLEGERLGLGVAVISAPEETPGHEAVGGARDELDAQLRNLANEALRTRSSFERKIGSGETGVRVWVDFRLERPSLGVFGAGDDVQPLVRLAKELGWFVWVADGRSHLVTRERFPTADELSTLPVVDGDGIPLVQWTATFPGFRSRDAVVVMTHSFEQDARILAFLLTLKSPPAYIGVLGPQRRTRELLWAAAGILHLPAHAQAAQVEGWLEKLHAPMGLDLGAESPETIALAVLAEIQKLRTSATALPLREVRAVPVVFSR